LILLDENMAHNLRLALSAFDAVTVQYRGWSGLKNGELLEAAESAGFTVFITGDKTLEYEQNLSGRKIAIISLSAPHLATGEEPRRGNRGSCQKCSAGIVHTN
jgi:hypothetical protein